MKVFIVHGSYGTPFVNWQPWLVEQLNSHGITCTVPAFPTPEHQNYCDWKKLLDYYYELGIMTSDTVYIGHSAGSICIAKYLAEKNIKGTGLIMTAGYNNFLEDTSPMKKLNETFYTSGQALNKISSNIKYRYNIVGDNDPYIPFIHFQELAESVNAEMIIIQNGGHLNSRAGYTKFERLLEVILSMQE